MKVARVIGNIWATREEEKLASLKLLLIQPLGMLTGETERPPIVTADIIGAGVGETVLMVGGSSTRSVASDVSIPMDTTVVSIVDDQRIDRSVLPWRGDVAAARRKLPRKE